MNCRQFRQFYSDFADCFLDPTEDLGFQAHMAECDGCRRFHEALQEGCSALQRLDPPARSQDFDARLMERILSECESQAPPLRQWSGFAGAALVVAAFGLIAWEGHNWAAARHAEPAQAVRPDVNPREAFVVRFAGDTMLRYPGHLPVVPVSRDTFRSATRPAQSFEITVDWMTP